MAKWFTSDLHFGHYNVIEYCKRPYADVVEMNEALADGWNSVVTSQDDVYFLGDWCLHHKYYIWLAELNFRHLFFVDGNHDRVSKLKKMLEEDSRLTHLADKITIQKNLVVELGGQQFYCTHRPLQSSDDMPNLVGHVHEKWTFMPAGVEVTEHSRNLDKISRTIRQPMLNVGCDVHGYKPINEEQVLEWFK